MSTEHGTNTFTIELPTDVLTKFAQTPEAFAKELRLAAAIEWYREGRISQGRAAELAGLSRWEFVEALGRVRVDVIHEDALLEDVERAVREHERSEAIGQDESGGEFTTEEAELHYRALGRWKGRLAAPDVQAAARRFWRATGGRGADWLARRLRIETHVDSLHGAASQLADLGPVALGPIVEELRDNPAADQARALLQALGWMAESASAPTVEDAPFELILAQFLQHRDPDTREAAARAMQLLPPERAVHWLTLRRRDEPDADVMQTIEDELEHRRAARA
jgi:predicted HTH domain antitoxin